MSIRAHVSYGITGRPSSGTTDEQFGKPGALLSCSCYGSCDGRGTRRPRVDGDTLRAARPLGTARPLAPAPCINAAPSHKESTNWGRSATTAPFLTRFCKNKTKQVTQNHRTKHKWTLENASPRSTTPLDQWTTPAFGHSAAQHHMVYLRSPDQWD